MIKLSRKTDASSPSGGFRFATGSYAGNGAATQAIAGVGFQPKFVLIYERLAAGTQAFIGVKTDKDGARCYRFIGGAQFRYTLDDIISLDVGGFTVGDGTPIGNVFNRVENYSYWCWR